MDNQTAASKDVQVLTKAEVWLLTHIFGMAKGMMIVAALQAQGWIAH